MKKLTFLAVALIVIASSCKKDEKAPTPGTPPVTASGMTATETALLGTWIWDKTEYWNGGSLLNLFDPAYMISLNGVGFPGSWIGPATFECKSSIYLAGLCSTNMYDALIYGGFNSDTLSTTPHGTSWLVSPIGYDGCSYVGSSLFPKERVTWFPGGGDIHIFPTNANYFIEVLNSTNLVLTSWDTSPTGTGGLANGDKYYYHK